MQIKKAQFTCSKDIDEAVAELTEKIRNAVISTKTKNVHSSMNSMPWWSAALLKLRTEARRAYKNWSKIQTENSKDNYHKAKKMYQRA